MSKKVIVTKSKLNNIGDAIRIRTGENGRYTLDEIAEKILSISGDIPEPEDPSSDNKIYGVVWDRTESHVFVRTDDAENFSDPIPSVNGSTGSSPFDSIYPWSKMTIVDDRQAGKLVKIPKFYFKWTDTTGQLKLQITKNQKEGFTICPACADRGDGAGEREYILVGRYPCGVGDYKSKSGVKPTDNVSCKTARNAIHLLGDTVWQFDAMTYYTICMLYLVEYADWDSQGKIGFGCSNVYNQKDDTGLTDSMPYHTGTTGATLDNRGQIQYRYIEGLWSGVCTYIDGMFQAGYSNRNIFIAKNPLNFENMDMGWDEEHGYINTEVAVPSYSGSDGLIRDMRISQKQDTNWYMGVSSIERGPKDYSRYICDYMIGTNYDGSIPFYTGGSYTTKDEFRGAGLFLQNVETGYWVYGQDLAINGVGARLIKLS